MHCISLGSFKIGHQQPLVVISGPCIIESKDHAIECAASLVELCQGLNIPLIFKASYDKANRSSINSFRGPGLVQGLEILAEIKKKFNIPVTTDIHECSHAALAAEVVDILQIPAFLCRQTDLLIAAAQTGKIVNVKKGQFLAPWDMKNVVDKLTSCGCKDMILTERGTCFGYNNLVSDMRAIPIMAKMGFPVCFDASHSAQLPGGQGTFTGGQREFIPALAKAAIVSGSHLLFIESHPDPERAKSDSTTVYPYSHLKPLLTQLKALHELTLQF
jgi:2-dehydro-3-deoxyphosphooctonate aldolase (KDO 8-P synthase)